MTATTGNVSSVPDRSLFARLHPPLRGRTRVWVGTLHVAASLAWLALSVGVVGVSLAPLFLPSTWPTDGLSLLARVLVWPLVCVAVVSVCTGLLLASRTPYATYGWVRVKGVLCVGVVAVGGVLLWVGTPIPGPVWVWCVRGVGVCALCMALVLSLVKPGVRGVGGRHRVVS